MLTKTFPNNRYGHKTPPEDSSNIFHGKFGQKILAVADGITRDPNGISDFKNPEAMELLLDGYPNPSPARAAADYFVDSFVEHLQYLLTNSWPLHVTEEDVKNAFVTGNQKIQKLNEDLFPDVDYLCKDYAGCVAAGGVIEDNTLTWAAITDCGLIVYSNNGEIKFQSEDWMLPFVNYLKTRDNPWHLPEGRQFVRRDCRNKPNLIIDGKCVSYGALTGEESAHTFIHTGRVQLEEGDLVIFHTDGLTPILARPDFFENTYKLSDSLMDQSLTPYLLQLAIKDSEKFGKEKTIIAYIHYNID